METITLHFTHQRDILKKAISMSIKKNNEYLGWKVIAVYLPLSLLCGWLIIQGKISIYFPVVFILLSIPPFCFFRKLANRVKIVENALDLHCVIEEDAFTFKGDNPDVITIWQSIQNIYENAEYYYLEHKKINLQIVFFIPKGAFVNPEHERQFLELVKTKIGKVKSISVGTGYVVSQIIIVFLYLSNIILLFYSNFRGIH